jgi:type IV secretory pathway VirJ component
MSPRTNEPRLHRTRPRRPRRFRSLPAIAAVLILLVAGALGYAGYLGWFGGPVYRLIPATGTTPPALRGTAVVFFTGDSGFDAGMAPKVMVALGARGVPVLAVNSLTSFASRHTPAQARDTVVAAVTRALALPGVTRVVLAGQSFGADMVQYAASDMPARLRPRIVQVLLSVPGDTLLFKATPAGLLDGAPDRPALPSAQAIDWAPLLCIYGAEQDDSLCPLLRHPNVRAVALPGGHHLHNNAALLADTMWQAILRGR